MLMFSLCHFVPLISCLGPFSFSVTLDLQNKVKFLKTIFICPWKPTCPCEELYLVSLLASPAPLAADWLSNDQVATFVAFFGLCLACKANQ